MSALSSQPRPNPTARIIVIGISIALHIGLAVYLYRQIPASPNTATAPTVEMEKTP